jgi:DNA-binding transcriptional LysR family regulator
MIYDQRQLRAFLAIIEQGSLNRAAANVHMTQPTLSRLLADMERRLGQRLFERNAKGMTPTPAGDILIPYARMILHEMDAADEALQALRGLKRGSVRVGAVATVARSILPLATAQLLTELPGLRMTLIEGPDDVLVTALLQRKIDIMITAALPHIDGVSNVRECSYDDVYSVFCAHDHHLAGQSSVTLDDVLAQDWALPQSGATPRELFSSLLVQVGKSPPTVAVEAASLDATISFVARTRLLGWLPRPLLTQALGAGLIRLLHVPELALRRRFFIYRRDQGLLPAPARELLKLIPCKPYGDFPPDEDEG